MCMCTFVYAHVYVCTWWSIVEGQLGCEINWLGPCNQTLVLWKSRTLYYHWAISFSFSLSLGFYCCDQPVWPNETWKGLISAYSLWSIIEGCQRMNLNWRENQRSWQRTRRSVANFLSLYGLLSLLLNIYI